MNPEVSPASGHANEEIAALIETLRQTESRLEALTAGEVDTVTDREGRTILLRRAQEQLRHSDAARQAAILDALPAQIALLDTQGLIISVNDAWRQFAAANSFQGPANSIGVNYLDICDRAQGDDAFEASEAAEGIRSVLGGGRKNFSLEYPCHSPTEQRWFLMMVTPLAGDPPHGAVVMHLNITERKVAEAKSWRQTKLFAALSHCNEAIVRCVSEEELFPQVCRAAVEFGGMKMAWIGMIESATRMLRPAASFGDITGDLENLTISADADSPFGRGPTGTAIRENLPYWCQDVAHDPLTVTWRERALLAGLAASASLPLHRNGVVVGVFTLYSGEANAFDEPARDLLSNMAADISFALDNFSRESRRKSVEDELLFKNTILKTQQETSLDAILVVGENGQIISRNQRFIDLWRLAPDVVNAGVDAPVLQAVAEQAADSEAFIARVQYLYEHRDDRSREEIALKDGRTIDRYSAPIAGANGKYYGRVWYFRDITERKYSAQAIEQSLLRLNEAQRIGRIGDWDYNLATQAITWSPQVFEILGRDPRFGPPADLEEALAVYDAPSRVVMTEKVLQAIETGEAQDYELMAPRPGGEQVHVRAMAVPLKDEGGKVVGLYGTIQDITARKRSEAALKESDSRYRSLFDNMLEGYAYCRTVFEQDQLQDFIYLEVNGALEKLTGLKNVIGKKVSEVVPGFRESNRPFLETCGRVALTGETEKCETYLEALDVWLSIAVYSSEREHFVAVFDNITDRKRAGAVLLASELKQRNIAEQLEIERSRLVAAQQVAKVGSWETDLATMSVIWSDETHRIHGTDPAAFRPTHRGFMERVHPQDRADVEAAFDRSLRQPAADNKIEHRLLLPDGEIKFVEERWRVIFEAEESPVRAIGTCQDITERKQAEAARASLEAQLRESQKMEAIGTLAGGIAHDFNNILATILGNTELARQDMNSSPRALESLEEIHKAASRARDLVLQILSFSRRQPTELKRTALAPIVEEAARLLRATLLSRLTLDVHCDNDVPAVLADATQMQQIVINLVNNAGQAAGDGRGRIGIHLDTALPDEARATAHPALRELQARHPGRMVRLAVSDDGPGMDAATLAKIFEPFFTTKAVGEGTGLGLAVVHGIVQAHEGAIVVDSHLGGGATFTVYLPAAAAQSVAPALVERTAAKGPSPGVGNDQHILYLDDDESLAFLVPRLLERRGYRISSYTDQRQALDALRADPASFDLVVTDYNMPDMSGLDVARAVRAIRSDLPVAIASGFIDEALRAQADEAGVRELIFKANAAEDLCDAFARLAQTVATTARVS